MSKSAITLETIYHELEFIKEKVIDIEKHMVDIDSILSEDDYLAIVDYKNEKSKGELISHEALKEELGL